MNLPIAPKLRVAFTGHRPVHFRAYERPGELGAWIRKRMREELDRLQPSEAISGMALGVDQWGARLCIEMKIPFIAAIPFLGQAVQWTPIERANYRDLLSLAKSVHIVSPGGIESTRRFAYDYQKRNEWMVDRADLVLAVYDGTAGGTHNCVEYAREKQKPIVRIDPRLFKEMRQ